MEQGKLSIVHTVSTLLGGGMEHFALRLAEAQRRRGHDASILSVYTGPVHALAEEAGVPVSVLGPVAKPARVLRAAASFARRRPALIHAHNPTSMQYASVGKLVTGARLVVTDHTQTRGVVRVASRAEWALTDAVVAVSRYTSEQSYTIGATGPVGVIHNGITVEAPRRTRAEVRAALGLPEDRVVGIDVAGLIHVKGHDVLVDALASLRDEGTPVTILVAGEGEEEARIQQRIRDRGLGPDHIRMLGFRTDVTDLLAACDFFVLSSRLEGLSLAVLEAMAQRLPVLISRVGGNPEIIDDGVEGLLLPANDPVALAAAIKKLGADPALRRRLGEAGHRRVLRDFSFAKMVEAYEALYASTLRRPRRPL
jgi:glycosyltransferase involved in cell wall biosynthesis